MQEKRAATQLSLYYDLPLNSFTPTDHHAANERAPIKKKKREKKTKKRNLRGKRHFFNIQHVRKNDEIAALFDPHVALKTENPPRCPFSQINVSQRGKTANVS